ncbi:heat-inducible transcriptional repressor HrcA [Arthrobacter sp. UM1]|uniref:heat-inducible transcriptional repressor HrcA n=1 Tax=Arthrobacter sp. UM1 TaxID=2766776 RepID=UPI001CF6C3AF|nr:heat-inducible transcriptional repressor HrcA [Arthrobacter sp. UM1]MCB4207547.1 heat-inducible transcriptional repressor HrcA [Arthrobacter sp. UM1]
MTSERRLAVLRAIVEDYVSTSEPVGSKALVERHSLNVSPATIRNDMAALEEEGLITAPHTSAGRIPTDRGYRTFVDRLSEIKPLSAAERKAIRTLLEGAEDLDDVMGRSVRLLSQLTHQAALIQYPVSSSASVKTLEIVGLSETVALVVLITSAGAVTQRTVHTPGHTEAEITASRDFLRALSSGLPLALAAARFREAAQAAARAARGGEPEGVLRGAPGQSGSQRLAEMAAACADLCDSFSTSKIVMSGTAHLARSTSDFASTITPVLEALEEQVVLMKLLAEIAAEDTDLEVRIGRENDGALAETAVVLGHYGVPSAQDGALGVIGPTRMDYASSMSAVRAVARYVTRILHANE